jgi:hypothetical protein
VIRAEQDLPGTKEEWGQGWGREAGWRNDPNNVCTVNKWITTTTKTTLRFHLTPLE